MNTYIKGNQVRLTARFSDSVGTPVDPTAVVFKMKVGNTSTTYTYGTHAALVKSGVGVYYVDVLASTEAMHTYRFEGTSATSAAAQEGSFIVPRSVF